MDDLVKTAKAQLEERAKSLKWEMEKAIDEKVENILGQFNQLASLPIPADILKLYTEVGGKIWVSKRIWVDDENQTPKILHGSRYITYANPESRQSEFQLPKGGYKLVVMAIPTEISGDRDDYERPIIK